MIEDRDKKIIFVIGSMKRGGAERVISILANHYADKGWKVKIITLLDSGNDYILRNSIKIVNLTLEKKSRIEMIPFWITGLRKSFRQFKPDVIVSFIARINLLVIISSLGLRKKVIISERNDPKSDGRSLLTKMATRILYPLVEHIVFQTNWAQSCFPEYIQRKGSIIYNPIDIKIKAIEMKQNKIVAVGRLIEQKNHKLLVDAFSKVVEKYPEYKLYIYGEGRLRKELECQIDRLDISDKVFLPGNILNIHDEIKDAKLFVLSSDYEGLSNALLEAMIMGLPCISTNCAGSNEIIEHGNNGLLVQLKDKVALYEAILQLIKDPEKAKELSTNALASSNKYRVENAIYEWEKIIEA